MRIIFSLTSALLFFSCLGPGKSDHQAEITPEVSVFRYAKRFHIRSAGEDKVLSILGNRDNMDTTAVFVLYRDKKPDFEPPHNTWFIRVPCKKIAALSSIYAAMISELGSIDALAAIDNIDYVNDTLILQKFRKGKLKELARMPEPDLEATVALDPDIVFTFGMGNKEQDTDRRLYEAGIPAAVSVDHLEATPLARAEWLKFFAAFVGKDRMADSIFNSVEQNYMRLRKLTENVSRRPTVFSEIKYGDTWYVPGGKSYVATLLKDTGADYLWKEDNHTGSLPLSFEQVYAKASDCDFWINLPKISSMRELKAAEERYTAFKAFREGNVYNNDKNRNALGYSTYWETGMFHPDRILSDLVQIFHPGLAGADTQMYYYRKLGEQ